MTTKEYVQSLTESAKINLQRDKTLIPCCMFILKNRVEEGFAALPLWDLDNAPKAIKKLCGFPDVRAYIFISEGWAAQVPEYFQNMVAKGIMKPEDFPNPSEALNRKEVITVLSKERNKPAEQTLIFFDREKNGTIKFIKEDLTTSIDGRFANLI